MDIYLQLLAARKQIGEMKAMIDEQQRIILLLSKKLMKRNRQLELKNIPEKLVHDLEAMEAADAAERIANEGGDV